jgi:hypothetical protein
VIQRFLQGARKDSLWRSLPAWYPSGQAGSKRASFVVICRLLLPGLRSSRGSSLQRWISTERALHRVRTIRANGEMAAPMHGRTGVSPLHTLHPRPPLRLPPACVRIASTTSKGIYRVGKWRVQHHIAAATLC